MKQIVPLVVLRQGIGTMREQQLYNLEMTFFAGPKYGCSLSITSFRVDVGSRLDEKVTKRMVAINSSPLQFPYISILPSSLARIAHPRTCSAVMPCSSADFALYRPLSNSFCIPLSSPNLANCIKSCSTGSCGGLESKSLSSTRSKPSFPGELVALPECRRWSGVVEGSRDAMMCG